MGVPYAEVIGDPIAHSKSPLIHKYWLSQLGMEGDYRATRVTVDELPAYVATRRTDRDWRGCNVTMPHKSSIAALIDEVRDYNAGAVNCVVPHDGGLYGFNSDVAGVEDATVQWGFGYPESRVCLIGAGGGARSAILALDTLCYFIFDLVVRDEAKGRAFLESCNRNGNVFSIENAAAAIVGCDAVINASPLGMAEFPPMPDAVLSSLARAGTRKPFSRKRRGYAFDMVTTPVRTEFLERAEAMGLSVSDGLTMLIGQARSAFHSFFGAWPPEGDGELRERLTS